MTHIILLLYLLSGISGITSILYLIMKYGRHTPFMKGYVRLHLSYTLLMLAALTILYLRVNVINSPEIMALFISAILLGMGFLCWSLAQFSFILHNKGLSRMVRLFWNIFPFFYLILAIAQYLLSSHSLAFLPIILGVGSFVIVSLYFSSRSSRSPDPYGMNSKRLWLFFMIFTLVVIAAELILKWTLGFLGEYTINIPLIFLAWNFLSLAQFKRTGGLPEKADEISRELIEKWKLTAREVEISRSIRRGDSNKEIASDLKISASTVKNHIYNIYQKTGARGRVDLVNLLK